MQKFSLHALGVFRLRGHGTLSGGVREDVHQEIHNRNPARNRRERGVCHSVPQGPESQITASDDWGGGMSGAKCTIMAIALERLL